MKPLLYWTLDTGYMGLKKKKTKTSLIQKRLEVFWENICFETAHRTYGQGNQSFSWRWKTNLVMCKTVPYGTSFSGLKVGGLGWLLRRSWGLTLWEPRGHWWIFSLWCREGSNILEILILWDSCQRQRSETEVDADWSQIEYPRSDVCVRSGWQNQRAASALPDPKDHEWVSDIRPWVIYICEV